MAALQVRFVSNFGTSGLTARGVVRPQERHEFEQHRSALIEIFNPNGVAEQDMFELMVNAKWNVKRCEILERQLSSDTESGISGEERARKIDLIRQFKKSLKSTVRLYSAVLRRFHEQEG